LKDGKEVNAVMLVGRLLSEVRRLMSEGWKLSTCAA